MEEEKKIKIGERKIKDSKTEFKHIDKTNRNRTERKKGKTRKKKKKGEQQNRIKAEELENEDEKKGTTAE